jgi:hypothetical protein
VGLLQCNSTCECVRRNAYNTVISEIADALFMFATFMYREHLLLLCTAKYFELLLVPCTGSP